MGLGEEDVREILRIIDESELDEIRVETAGFSLHVLRGRAPAPAPEPDAPESAAEAPILDGAVTIRAPMLGTFYRAEAPGAKPFVEVGTRVEPSTIVCLIEVMKMMNSVPAGVEGTIAEICPENAELVEPGQPLFRIETAR